MSHIEENSSAPYLAWVEAVFPDHKQAKNGWVTVCCPIHGDSNPSMGINTINGGVRCHTGACGWKGTVRKLCEEANLPTDLLPRRGRPASVSAIGNGIVTYYPYYDLTGQPVFRVKRVDHPDKPKDIFQETWVKGAWVNGGPDELPLFNVQAIQNAAPDQPILFLEGEKKAVHGNDRDLLCTCAPGGAGKAGRVHVKYWALFEGRIVYILPDEDESGIKHAMEVAAILQDVGARCKIVRLPGLPRKGDLADWLILPKKAEDVLQVCEAAKWLPPVSAQPTIFFEDDWNLVDHVNQANKALQRWNNPPKIFKQGAALVRLKAGDDGKSVPDTVTKEALFLYAAEAAKWVKVTRVETRKGVQEHHQEVYPNKDVVSSMHHHPDPPVPVLNRIVRAPVFVAEGRVLRSAGFDYPSGVLYEPDPCFKGLKVPEKPSDEEVAAARSMIADQFLGDYPWQDSASLSHSFAALLTPFVRDMFRLCPFFFVNATVERSGKTKLVNCFNLIHNGRSPTTLTYINNEEELRKRLTSQLKAMPTILLLDNVPKRLDSATLAAMATMEYWEDRELSRTLALRIPIRCITIGTGNNTTFSGEICKRIIHIRIQHPVERPELRTDFRIKNLEAWVVEHRRQLALACLTLVQHWIVQGKPQDESKRLGGFEEWSTQMAGLLNCIGVNGFLTNYEAVAEEADTEGQQIAVLVSSWRDAFGASEVTASDLQQRFKNSPSDYLQALLRGETDRAQTQSLGHFLKRSKGRMVDGFVISSRLSRGTTLYAITARSEQAPKVTQADLDAIGDVV